ncbi:MAG: hypothetical protein HY721_03815 [Planctomycetes bacterium]|nr:hypothetical protein [Planctomycetota bacterium]
METLRARTACPQCGGEIEDGARCCAACGAALVAAPDGGASQPAFELAAVERPSAPGLAGAARRLVARLAAAGDTAAAIASRPSAAFRSFGHEGPLGPALAFATLIGGPSLLIDAALKALLGGEEPPSGPAALALVFAVPPLYVVLRSQALHLALVLSGRARGSFRATLRAVAYSSGAVAPLLVVPVAGECLFLAAGAYVEGTGIRWGHGLGARSAALAEMALALALVIGMAAVLAVRLLSWSPVGP